LDKRDKNGRVSFRTLSKFLKKNDFDGEIPDVLEFL